jgi:hypothetical protein
MTTPKVFISYSHDSKEHNAWVADLTRFLVSNGIDVVIDAKRRAYRVLVAAGRI